MSSLAAVLEGLSKELGPSDDFDVTIVLATGEKVTGILEVVDRDVTSIRRLVNPESYADIPRHYATSAIIGAYYTESS